MLNSLPCSAQILREFYFADWGGLREQVFAVLTLEYRDSLGNRPDLVCSTKKAECHQGHIGVNASGTIPLHHHICLQQKYSLLP